MKQITIWVPDVNSAEFARQARRQSLLVAENPADEDEQTWVDDASAWTA